MKKIVFPKRQQLMSTLSSLTEKLVVVLVVAYIALSVSKSVMKNYDMNRRINNLKTQIKELDRQQAYLHSLIAYYQTNTFKELKAREELGYHKGDEKVISVPVEPDDKPLGAETTGFYVDVEAELPIIPNYQKWYNYFFG